MGHLRTQPRRPVSMTRSRGEASSYLITTTTITSTSFITITRIRTIIAGESVTASAGSITNPVDWTVEGLNHDDPAVVSFSTGGEKDIYLNVYAGDGVTLIRNEICRIVVLPELAVSIAPVTSGGDIEISWYAISGTVYQVESKTGLISTPEWTDVDAHVTATVDGVILVPHPSGSSIDSYRICVLE